MDLSLWGDWILRILMGAVGLGAVIFVHELGHFVVAKLCGVKCEKFFIGFDIGGWKISRRWGETEYGIGILPLGGYVKMLGQDDNPANITEQMRESEVHDAATAAKEMVGPDGKTYLIDRRSYQAKTVPQRMAIISAGVVMNVIFAFIFATIAYKIGVPYNPTIVSQTAPGSPSWRVDVRPGDEVVRLGDIANPSFDELRTNVTLGDLEAGLPFEIKRGDEILQKQLVPAQVGGGLPRVGIAPPASLRISKNVAPSPGSPAARATPPLQGGDEIIAVDGQPVAKYAELAARLARQPDQPLELTVRRGGSAPADDNPAAAETVAVTLPPRPMQTLGLVMQMGKIVAVQANSPAAEAKIQPGDFIEAVGAAADAPADADAATQFNPVTVAEDLRRMAEDTGEVKLRLRREARRDESGAEGRQAADTFVARLRRVDWLESAIAPNDPQSIPALGLAYQVLSVVDRVEPDSPADKAGLAGGDFITKAEFIFPADYADKPDDPTMEFSDDDSAPANWPAFVASLQSLPEGSQVKLTYLRGKEERAVTLAPVDADGYFWPERGLVLDLVERTRLAGSWAEAVRRGSDETVRSLGMVYRFLRKLGTQISVTTFGGPITIFQGATSSASAGMGKLLLFLTMLSANLAVINFLPIPLLDGGHMAFLLWEGIRGKPAGEKFVVAMHTAGFVFIISLMLFVIALDLGYIPRNL